MAEYAEKIVDEAKTAGIIPILLNPNATLEAYSDTVKFGDVMKQTAEKKSVEFIDLSKLTYTYLNSLYGEDTAAVKANLALNTSDNTHTSYVGAMKYASIVANELYKMGHIDMINTVYTYTKADNAGNEIKCNALIGVDIPTEPTSKPTTEPTAEPTNEPTSEPTTKPTTEPTSEPTTEPTAEPTSEPTTEPTNPPKEDDNGI